MTLSPRLAAIVDALPLDSTSRVLEIGCGPGAAAREVARRVRHVLAIDRSPAAVRRATAAGAAEIAAGRLSVRCVAIEDLALDPHDEPFDLAFAVRVGVLDGRHPADRALTAIAAALRPGGRLVVDGVERVSGVVAAPREGHDVEARSSGP
ncbi:class I SAM-dependent methyltransferase [Actinomycetospora termitidis]|uniref:Class I SAM-dependent methyltransferase n=1 Tax=Actinomycetospora termitidis TaxID=3053470 RepID=A0ABT7MI40_9PSEU|nr:class I SAM-dependent methyltransferase [Actinomycetospora sp. Odt1-22]MDL5160335.1 class I SAM-dependent methyltransferase [Actinomycetospora sp. Odt1-22]